MNGNAWLVNEYCELVNKTLNFTQSYFEGVIPAGRLDETLYWKTKDVYHKERLYLQDGRWEDFYGLLGEYLNLAKEYCGSVDLKEAARNDRRACRNAILNSIQLIANLTVLISPVAAYPTAQVSAWLALDGEWEVQHVHSGYELPETHNLTYERGRISA